MTIPSAPPGSSTAIDTRTAAAVPAPALVASSAAVPTSTATHFERSLNAPELGADSNSTSTAVLASRPASGNTQSADSSASADMNNFLKLVVNLLIQLIQQLSNQAGSSAPGANSCMK